MLHSLQASDASCDSFMSLGSIETLVVHYRVLVDKLLVHSQTVSAGAYFRIKFPDGKCDMNDILTALELLPLA